VTIIQRSVLPLERVLGAQLGAIYRDLHLERGVELRSRTALEALEGDGAVGRVRMAGGSTIDCDFVVVGIGVTPRTTLAEAAGIEV
jgi:3-phenylpropionate/trans-cinnamate dioxygenase ferredoxin reductase component